MNVFYEEDGGLKAGNVLSDQGAAMQVESASGKRSKVKSGHVLFDFREPDAGTLMRDAQTLAETIDLAFLWECAPQAEFSFKDLATDYFGRAATPVESAALITRLHSAPMYFYRKGRGRYRPAPADALKAALAGIERKQREAALQADYVSELKAGRLPDALRAQMRDLLFKPDRNRAEWKALIEASSALSTTPERLMLAVGGLTSPEALHRDRFIFEYFPRGTGFADVRIPAIAELPLADAEAFSIDDSQTTEIDDALSVRAMDLPSDELAGAKAWRIGIHIAAPGLAIARGDALDALARERYSTVYAPGEKITMLPDRVVEAFTLAAGQACAAVSLYVDAIETTGETDAGWRIVASTSRIERVAIVDNLRHDVLDEVVTDENLASGEGDYPRKDEIAVLWRFAQAQNEKRQQARVASGLKRESHQRADYNFRVAREDAEDAEAAPGRGGPHDTIAITERRRGAPLDTIVAELMILANSTWGGLLAERNVSGIYRAQNAAFGPAGRVRMITHPAPHAGLGVAQYAWSTSPLRRYVDLVNQWQIVACIADPADDPARDRAVAAPFARNDADLFAIVSGFDAAYAAYAEYQSKMERYWCLRWLKQEGKTIVEARATGREDNAILVEIPLLIRVPGLAGLATPVARGQRIELEIVSTDEIDLTVQCRLTAIIEEVDELDDLDESDEEAPAGAADASAKGIDAATSSAEHSATDAATSDADHSANQASPASDARTSAVATDAAVSA